MRNILTLLFTILILISCQEAKTGYVDNTKIMEGFEKLEEVKEKHTQEEEQIKASIDLLVAQSGYQELITEYQSKQGKMSKAKQEELYNKIVKLQQSLGQQQQLKSQEFQQRKNKEMDSLVNLVKDFVKEYGKTNGYTYIFGSNESGNILYGKEDFEITEEITTALNKKYTVQKEQTEEKNEVKTDSTSTK